MPKRSRVEPLPRNRDAEATRAALLAAALRRFARQGYDRVGVRDIAADAGVDAALVNRYFGGKAQLFAAAVGRGMAFGELLEGERTGLGERLARYVLQKGSGAAQLDPLLAQLRSAANEEAAQLFRQELEQTFVAPLADWLGGPDAELRAGLIASCLAGLATMRSVVKLTSLTTDDTDPLARRVGRTLQSYIDGE